MCNKIIITIGVLFGLAHLLQAQSISPQVIPSQGNYYSNGGTGISWTLGQTFTQTMPATNQTIALGFQQPNPLPDSLTPYAADSIVCFGSNSTIYIPTSQTGIRYDLMINNTLIVSGYGNGTTLALNTNAIDSNTNYFVLATDITTGCQIQLTPYLTIYTYKIGTPANAMPQLVLSDTAYSFTFNVNTGVGGNQVVWSLDSVFTISYTDTSPAPINVTLAPNSDTLIWLKSRDSVSGCTSQAITTIAILRSVQFAVDTIPDTIQAICAGNTTIVMVPNSLPGVMYKLLLANTVIDSSLGNDSTLILNTNTIDTNTTYKVLGMDTATHSIVYNDTGIYIAAIGVVDTPVFISGGALIYLYDSAWSPYTAYAPNSTRTIYSITSGTATIDSLTGQLYSVSSSSFTVAATAYGMAGCGTNNATMAVTVTSLAAPEAPAPQVVTVDSPQVVTVTFDSIYAGTGGDEIEWSFDPNFTTSSILSSPANISFSLQTGADTLFYLRSRSSTAVGSTPAGAVSYSVLAYAVVNLQFSAGLLDKTKWVYDNSFSDEFEYNTGNDSTELLPQYYNAFINKWYIAHIAGWPERGQRNCVGCNFLNNSKTSTGINNVWDYGGFQLFLDPASGHVSGDNGEVTIINGIVTLNAKQIPLQSFVYLTDGDTDCYINSVDWTSGMLYAKIPMSLAQPGIIEMRAELPYFCGTYTAFWNDIKTCELYPTYLADYNDTGFAELDIIDGYNTTTRPSGLGTGGGVKNWNCTAYYDYCSYVHPGCGYHISKTTPCDYHSNWHTWAAEWSNNKIIYFVDGKEIWDYNYGLNLPNQPLYLLDTAYWMVTLGAAGCGPNIPNYQMPIDYIRHYTPSETNSSPPQFFQNLYAGSPYTLETVDNGWPLNNNPINALNNNTGTTSSITAGCNIGMVTSGSTSQLFYKVGNGICTITPQSDLFGPRGTETVIHAYFSTFSGKVAAPNDVQDFITPVNANLIYYRNTSNGISCYVNKGSYWLEIQAPYLGPFNRCAGYITVDNLGRVWFKGTDNNLWCWDPSNDDVNQITTDGSVNGEVVMDACGCLAFYNNTTTHTLYQLWWWGTNPGNGFEQIAINPTVQVVHNSLALDDVNDRLYFIDNNNAVRYYSWLYLSANPNDLTYTTLGALSSEANNSSNILSCDTINNAATGLTLSYDKKTIYYIGSDNNIWYWFNDRDPFSANAAIRVPGGNWNQTALHYNVPIQGPLALEPIATLGRLFYVGSNSKLYEVDWTPADNAANCPSCTNATQDYPTKMAKINATDSVITISVVPNPSEHIFNVIISNLNEAGNAEFQVFDISGRTVYSADSQIPNGNSSYQLVWDATPATSGLYIYTLKLNGAFYSGKIIKN